jgi:hypothetical protein
MNLSERISHEEIKDSLDTYIGIEADDLESIFAEYTQADSG